MVMSECDARSSVIFKVDHFIWMGATMVFFCASTYFLVQDHIKWVTERVRCEQDRDSRRHFAFTRRLHVLLLIASLCMSTRMPEMFMPDLPFAAYIIVHMLTHVMQWLYLDMGLCVALHYTGSLLGGIPGRRNSPNLSAWFKMESRVSLCVCVAVVVFGVCTESWALAANRYTPAAIRVLSTGVLPLFIMVPYLAVGELSLFACY